MPNFFNPSELTVLQKARWDVAVAEYQRVQAGNAVYRFEHLTAEERAWHEERGATTDDAIKAELKRFSELMGNPPGHPKSALFARLLNGQEALPFPPPRSYSYPWYSVIEKEGWHRVHVEAHSSNREEVRNQGFSRTLSLNQCGWNIKSLNGPAQTLLTLNAHLCDCAKSRPENPDEKFFDWSGGLLDEVKDAYAFGPEFIVQYGSWPEFRLFVGQKQCDTAAQHGVRHFAKEDSGKAVLLHGRVWSVFDLHALGFNKRIGKTLRSGAHPKNRLQEAHARYDRLVRQNQGESLEGMLDHALMDQQIQALQDEVLKFEADPTREDWVEIFLDLWYLEKVAG